VHLRDAIDKQWQKKDKNFSWDCLKIKAIKTTLQTEVNPQGFLRYQDHQKLAAFLKIQSHHFGQ
jgi:hypothetical protein